MKAETPETVETLCRSCGEETEQRVLKGKTGRKGVEGTFECLACGQVHSGLVPLAKGVLLPMIVSKLAESYRSEVEVLADEVVSVGDDFEIEDDLVEVTAVELKDGRRVMGSPPEQIATLWSKSIAQVRVRFAMNVGDVTRSYETYYGPEEEIAIGEAFDLGETKSVVDRILTTEGTRYRGSYNVRDIRRVWLRSPKAADRPAAPPDEETAGPGDAARPPQKRSGPTGTSARPRDEDRPPRGERPPPARKPAQRGRARAPSSATKRRGPPSRGGATRPPRKGTRRPSR